MIAKRVYTPNKELFDYAVMREYRTIQRFFDVVDAETFLERFNVIRNKIFTTNSATTEELLEVAELIKRYN